MKPSQKLLFLPILLILAVLFTGSVSFAYTDGMTDWDGDGIITYIDQSQEEIEWMEKGYSAGAKGTFQTYYSVYGGHYVLNVGLPNIRKSEDRTAKSYHKQSINTKRYYLQVRYDREMYPRDTRQWVVTRSWQNSETGEWEAAVNCTYPHVELKTPETIIHEGNKCKVTTLELTNAYTKKLTITDNITRILKCQCPMLKQLNGGLNVEWIGKEAFKNCIYLTNMPYFPYLKVIQSRAFEGCFNLTEVLLPPMIETLWWDAFGWYDVVLGNYDESTASEDDQLYTGEDAYTDLYKIFGVKLYASKGSKTWETLEDLFSDTLPSFAHLSHYQSSKYPGTAGDIEIPDEEEVKEWLPVLTDPSTIDWGESKVDINDKASVKNALTKEQKEVLYWLEGLLLKGEINDDMFLCCVSAMSGVNPVHRDFLLKYTNDPMLYSLIALNQVGVEKLSGILKMTEAERQEVFDKARARKEAEEQRRLFLKYLCDNLIEDRDRIQEELGVFLDEDSKITEYTNHLTAVFDYVSAGDTWGAATAKVLVTNVCSAWVDKMIESNPELYMYEETISALFGDSVAKDVTSIKDNANHLAEFISDMLIYPTYDAWTECQNFADDKKWRAFKILWMMDVKEVLNNLYLENGAKYGNNAANALYLYETITDPTALSEIFDGYMDMVKEGKLFSNFLQDVYDVTVKDNENLEKFESNISVIMTGWMELYYMDDDYVVLPEHNLYSDSELMKKYIK